MSTAPVLVIPDKDEHYEMVCKASGYGIGADFMQKERPVAYHSYKLNIVGEIIIEESKSYWQLRTSEMLPGRL